MLRLALGGVHACLVYSQLKRNQERMNHTMNGTKKTLWLMTAVLAIGLAACGKDKMEDQGGMDTPMATMQDSGMMKDDGK